jgi:tetratricopeptide (TPR) repeat protein
MASRDRRKRGPSPRRRPANRRTPSGGGSPAGYGEVTLADPVIRELHATARPGKGEVLVKVLGRAAAAFAAEDYDEAIRLGEQAKHLALRGASVREFLGLAYYRTGRWKESARELSAFRRLTGSAEQNPVLADCYRALGRPERALELCDEIDPAGASAAVVYEGAIVAAGALSDMGRTREAVERLERLDLDPDVAEPHHLRAWYALADLLERRGRFTHARDLFEAVAAADDDLTDAAERVKKLGPRLS